MPVASSPVFRLPDELWADIFSSLHQGQPGEFSEQRSYMPAFLAQRTFSNLAQVCGFWRSIIHSRPHFWHNIIVLLDAISPRRDAAREEQLRVHLERSKTLPLRIWVMAQSQSARQHMPLMEICLSAASRWQMVDISVPWDALTDIVATLNLSLPQLKTLSLRRYAATWSPRNFPVEEIGPAPLLNEVTLDSLPFIIERPSLCSVNLPWKQLTRLCIRGAARIIYLIPTLAAVPNLEELCLHSCVFAGPEGASPLCLPKLHTLSVQGYLGRLGDHLYPLKLPALRDFSLWDYPGSFNCLPEISSLISRSGCVLEKLRLEADRFNNLVLKPISDFARISSSARELHLVGKIADKTLECLIFNTGQSPPHAPSLRLLSINGSLDDDGDGYEILADILASRNGAETSEPTQSIGSSDPNHTASSDYFVLSFTCRWGRPLREVPGDLAQRLASFRTRGLLTYHETQSC